MIGKLRGKVDAIGESHLIIDVHGVGYEVQASARTLRSLKLGEPASLTIDTHVREDAIRLFGFSTEVERSWFRTLLNVQGVGSKVALSLLGTVAPQDLANAIALGNWAVVEQAQGIGNGHGFGQQGFGLGQFHILAELGEIRTQILGHRQSPIFTDTSFAFQQFLVEFEVFGTGELLAGRNRDNRGLD